MTNEELYGICECYNVDFSDYITIKEHIESLKQQNTSLQARIKELEEKDKLKNCEECYDKVNLVFKMRGIE